MTITEAAKRLSVELAEVRTLTEKATSSGTQEDWDAVLTIRSIWEMRSSSLHDPHSVLHMTVQDIAEAIVADVSAASAYRHNGALGHYPESQIEKHVSSHVLDVIRNKLEYAKSIVRNLPFVKWENGFITIDWDDIDKAGNFSGVYYFDFDSATTDVVDRAISVGGTELLSEMIDDIAHTLEK